MASCADTRGMIRACEAWLATSDGEYARVGVSRIISHLISDWPRRGRRLLQVSCGSGRVSELFWEAGFDVTGVTSDPELMREAREYLGSRADIQLAAPECLPYDDNAFEFAALPFLCCGNDLLADSLREAFRVASKGVLLGFFNSWSLYSVSRGLAKSGVPALPPLHVYRQLRKVGLSYGNMTVTFRSVLSGPAFTWSGLPVFRLFNKAVLPHPFGAYAAFRVDCGARPELTPLTLRTSLVAARRQNACFLLKR